MKSFSTRKEGYLHENSLKRNYICCIVCVNIGFVHVLTFNIYTVTEISLMQVLNGHCLSNVFCNILLMITAAE